MVGTLVTQVHNCVFQGNDNSSNDLASKILKILPPLNIFAYILGYENIIQFLLCPACSYSALLVLGASEKFDKLQFVLNVCKTMLFISNIAVTISRQCYKNFQTFPLHNNDSDRIRKDKTCYIRYMTLQLSQYIEQHSYILGKYALSTFVYPIIAYQIQSYFNSIVITAPVYRIYRII